MSNLKGTYLFKDKDPIIDLLRTCMQTYASVDGLKFGKACIKVAERSGVKPNTLYNWFSGTTISPMYKSVAAVIIALEQLGIAEARIPIGQRTLRTRPRLVKTRGRKKAA